MTLTTRLVIDGFDILTMGNCSMLKSLLRALAVWLALVAPVSAAGTIPLALSQQFNINGLPLAGCLLYIYQTGTTTVLQQPFVDFGLTITAPNPMTCDATGRLPMFWLADGTVHARLSDASGVVLVDIPVLQ